MAERAGLATGYNVVAFNPAGLGNYTGKSDQEALGYCIQKYVNAGDPLYNIVNPFTDAIGSMSGGTSGTSEIGDTDLINNTAGTFSPLNFTGIVTPQEVTALNQITAALAQLNDASSKGIFETVGAIGGVCQQILSNWPQVRLFVRPNWATVSKCK